MISRTIQQLEDALGQQLFYRNTRAITPTESGKLFFEYAKRITEQFDEAQKALQDKTIEPSGLVRINTLYFWATTYCAVVGGFIRALSKASNRTNSNQ